jgi:hypothetical protein
MRSQSKAPCGCVSRLRTTSVGGDTNGGCHDFTGGLNPNSRRRLRRPSIVLVLWDQFFITKPNAVTFANLLMNDLIRGPFMNGLVQYGISDGAVLSTIVLDTVTHPAPATWDSGANDDGDQVVSWLNDGTLSPKPAKNEAALLFFLLLPTTTQLTNGKNDDGTPNTNVCGWHKHRKFNGSSDNDDLFWGVIRTDGADTTSERKFVNSVAFCAGHELAEAFTDRDGQGFLASNGCEIGDICETKTFFNYRGWNVEQYWSNWDSACIAGNEPISLIKFLRLMKLDPTKGVRALHTSVIDRNFMGSAAP